MSEPSRDEGSPEDPQAESSATRTRTSSSWVAVVVGFVVLLVLVIFILENGQQAKISFLGQHTRLPEGVGFLLAAVIGGLVVVFVGAARILQLRRRSRRN